MARSDRMRLGAFLYPGGHTSPRGGIHLNGLAPENAVFDAKSLAAIRMPNQDGFLPGPGSDVKP